MCRATQTTTAWQRSTTVVELKRWTENVKNRSARICTVLHPRNAYFVVEKPVHFKLKSEGQSNWKNRSHQQFLPKPSTDNDRPRWNKLRDGAKCFIPKNDYICTRWSSVFYQHSENAVIGPYRDKSPWIVKTKAYSDIGVTKFGGPSQFVRFIFDWLQDSSEFLHSS